MNTTRRYAGELRTAMQHAGGGVVGLVDELLRICWEHQLELSYSSDRWQVRSAGGAWEIFDAPLRKFVLRAILARFAALCNEHTPNAVTPYGGNGKIVGQTQPRSFSVVFMNTAAEQALELKCEITSDSKGRRDPGAFSEPATNELTPDTGIGVPRQI